MQKIGARGAALAEYAILLGLIAVVAIGTVSRLGDTVGDTFEEIAVVVSEIGTPTGDEEEVCGVSYPDGEVTEWTLSFHEDEIGASECDVPKVGDTWTMDVEFLKDRFPPGQVLYYDAWIRQTGVRTVGPNGESAYNLRPMSMFQRSEGYDQGILGGKAGPDKGYNDNTPNSTQSFTFENSVEGARVPSYATGIDIWTERYCTSRATCVDGPLEFEIRFYTR